MSASGPAVPRALLEGEGCSLCLCLTGETLEQDLQAAERHRDLVELVELRADRLRPGELSALHRFPRRCPLPAILTLRRPRDGGSFAGEEPSRRRLLARGLRGGFAAVDLEEDLRDPALRAAARRAGSAVIRSLHEFGGVGESLPARVRSLPHSPGELPKAVLEPRGGEDLVRLARAFAELAGVPKVLIGLGERGLFTRVLAPKLGCRLAYCAESGAVPAAPGQLDARSMCELYRFQRIGPGTQVFGVIGNPIAHSRSPQIHNRGYAALGLEAVYLPFLVEEAASFFELAEELQLGGFSVTMPFKEEVIPLLVERDPAVAAIGACNTVVRRGPRRWFGANTDAAGFLAPLAARAPAVLEAATRALVIGAGGAARSVVYALTGRGIRPLILNRTASRAQRLAQEFGCLWGPLGPEGYALVSGGVDLIVQATGAGMGQERELDPLAGFPLRGGEVVYDLVYDPPLTPLLARARAAGCPTVGGLEMLEAQGREQFLLFTGRRYPLPEAGSCRDPASSG